MNDSKNQRPNWDEYFIDIMQSVGTRGTCDRGQVGCVITKENRILTTGYAGAPSGLAHCDDLGHEMHSVTHLSGETSDHCIRTIHAEQNAIAAAARHGVSIEGGTLYCKMTPCYTCAKMICAVGISRVVAWKDYHRGERSREIFAEAGIQYDLIINEEQKYD
ncbi:MAG: cytidine/deoxycytidylate deaminase family protein [Candidatus Pacebacteria bacterium]|nr:cytidine/deoxycytidylate deaminase family protein [Candidatus Paceibacterota bacterium]